MIACSSDPEQKSAGSPRRWAPRYSLRTLLAVVTVIAVGLGVWVATRPRQPLTLTVGDLLRRGDGYVLPMTLTNQSAKPVSLYVNAKGPVRPLILEMEGHDPKAGVSWITSSVDFQQPLELKTLEPKEQFQWEVPCQVRSFEEDLFYNFEAGFISDVDHGSVVIKEFPGTNVRSSPRKLPLLDWADAGDSR